MKKLQILLVTNGLLLCTILTGCTAFQVQQATDTSATDMPLANIPNPASVYCEQNGNTLEIITAADGSQSGVCIFPDGSTCDEWAYFRGECGPSAQNNPTPAISDEATENASGNGAGEDASGGYMAPGTSEAIADWWGVIKGTESGAQYDDYFERQDLGQVIYFGIDSMNPTVQAEIKDLRDSGKIVHLYGTLFSNVPDYNGSQIVVDRLEVGEDASGGYMTPGTSEAIEDWWGVIKGTESGAQYDDYFERQDLGQVIYFGIDSMNPTVQAEIKDLRDSGKIVHLYGTLFSNVPDFNGSQIVVDRLVVEE